MVLKPFKDFLNESYVNAFDTETKEKYKDQVWKILQSSYKAIGGIKGNGFGSPDDMVAKIPMWKMDVYNGKVSAVTLYKDKNGRKSVACGTDGSDRGKAKIKDMIKNELMRSYGEKSKSALGTLLKLYPEDALKPFLKTPAEAERILKDDEVIAIKNLKSSEIPDDAKMTLQKYPYIKDYGYVREIGGDMVFKVMIGTEGKGIR
jgi:hypothetical protein